MYFRERYRPRPRVHIHHPVSSGPSQSNGSTAHSTPVSCRTRRNLRSHQENRITGPVPDSSSNSAASSSNSASVSHHHPQPSTSNLQRSTDPRIRRAARAAAAPKRSIVSGVCPSASPASPGFDYLSSSSSDEDLMLTMVDRLRLRRAATAGK